MMWSDLKVVIVWFCGEQEQVVIDVDVGVVSLMRFVVVNIMVNIRKVQEQVDCFFYQFDELLDSVLVFVDSFFFMFFFLFCYSEFLI